MANEPNYRKAREKAGYKVEQTAVALGVSVSTVYNWERGNTVPGADDLMAMARLYGVSADYLISVVD